MGHTCHSLSSHPWLCREARVTDPHVVLCSWQTLLKYILLFIMELYMDSESFLTQHSWCPICIYQLSWHVRLNLFTVKQYYEPNLLVEKVFLSLSGVFMAHGTEKVTNRSCSVQIHMKNDGNFQGEDKSNLFWKRVQYIVHSRDF